MNLPIEYERGTHHDRNRELKSLTYLLQQRSPGTNWTTVAAFVMERDAASFVTATQAMFPNSRAEHRLLVIHQ